MTSTLLYAVARKAESLTPDSDLLTRFIRERDNLSFEELVRRHGPLVWAVCRHLLPHHADAEDAFQAVFLALVRSAASIRDGRTVPAWLHGVAVRVATRVRRAAARRRQREHAASIPEAGRPVTDAAWESLAAVVHEEVQRLPEAERTAFVLCDLEGVSQPDAAARLGWPLGSLSGRLCKARRRLLDRLTARGVAPGVVVGIGITAGVASAVPAKLFDVVKLFPGSPGAASIAATALARGLTEGVAMRVKMMTAVVAVAFGLTGGAMVLSKAEAQPPAPGGAGGGGPPGAGAPGLPPGAGGAFPGLPPGAGGGGGDTDPFGAQPGGGDGPGMGGGWAISPATWEYKFVDVKNDRKEFEKVITQHGKDGWEFCSSERFGPDRLGGQELVLVFKKRKGGDFPFGGGIGLPGGGFPGGGGRGGWGPFGGEGGFGGRAGDLDFRVFMLKNATADDVVKALNKAFPDKGLKVVAEKSANAVVVISAGALMKDVVKMIESLDAKPSPGPGPAPGGPGPGPGPGGPLGGGPSGPGPMPGGPMGGGALGGAPGGVKPGAKLHVITLKHSTADEMAVVLKKVFSNAEVTPDARSNQLVIRADEATFADIGKLIQQLDVEVPKRK